MESTEGTRARRAATATSLAERCAWGGAVGPRGRSGHGRSCSGALGGDRLAPHRRAFQLDPVRAVNDAVEDRVTERGIGDHLVPFADGNLAGDQQRPAVVSVVDDLEQIAALLGIERLRPPIVDDQEPDAFERSEERRVGKECRL